MNYGVCKKKFSLCSYLIVEYPSFSSIIFFIPDINIQEKMLILPSKYWMSTNCEHENIKIDVHQALSNKSASFFLPLKNNNFPDLKSRQRIIDVKRIARGIP